MIIYYRFENKNLRNVNKDCNEKIEILNKKLIENDNKCNSSGGQSFYGNNSSYFVKNEFENENLKKEISNLEILLNEFKEKYKKCYYELENEKRNNLNNNFNKMQIKEF